MLISLLKHYGIQKLNNVTMFAAAESQEEIESLGYEAAPEESLELLNSRYYGVKLNDTILCYASGPDKKELVDMGYAVTSDKSDIISHGIYLWKKTYTSQKLIKDVE